MTRKLLACAVALLAFSLPVRNSEAINLPIGYTLTELVPSSLGALTGFSFLPDGRAFLIDKFGRVRIWKPGGANTTALVITNINTVGEAGLVGVAVDPRWPVKPFVYFHYNQMSPGLLKVVRYTATGDLTDPSSVNVTLGSPYTILTVNDSFSNHNGGCIRFDSQGLMYVSLGDDVLSCVAQDSTTLKGAIVRITLANLPDTGTGPPPHSDLVPPGNPFAPDTTGAELVWCFGLRNPFRFSIDPYTDLLYIADVGGGDYEEVDECHGGENWGWPTWEAFVETGVSCFRPLANFSWPIFDYYHDPADTTAPQGFFAICGGPIYRGGAIPQRFPLSYDGCYFYADVEKQWIRCQKLGPGGWLTKFAPGQPDSVNWATGAEQVSELQQRDGMLYFTTLEGSFRRIEYTRPVADAPAPPVPEARAWASPTPFRAGARTLFHETVGDLTVFDLLGRRVRTLEAPSWDGRDDAGATVSPGIYWVVDGAKQRVKVAVTK